MTSVVMISLSLSLSLSSLSLSAQPTVDFEGKKTAAAAISVGH